jgi:hypothetical protein
LPDPSLIFSYGWQRPKITLAAGVYAPYSSGLQFPDTGSQRYALIDMVGSLFVISHIAVGWEPHKRFRVGLGLQNYTIFIRLHIASSAYMGVLGTPEDPEFDLYTETRFLAPFNISGNAGIWGRILDTPSLKIDLASSVQLPVFVQARGELRVRIPTHPLFDQTTVDGKHLDTSFFYPLIVRAAMRFTILNRADIEAAFVFEGWSIHDKFLFTPVDNGIWVRDLPTVGDYKMPTINVPRDFQDAFSLRIGGSIQAIEKLLELRWGYIYETTAIPDRVYSVFLIDADKHIWTLGLTVIWRKMAFDISYAYGYLLTRDIQNSEYKQINPINPESAIPVGDGIYESSLHILGIAWRGKF